MKSKFQLDADPVPAPTPTLIDPEAFDVSEQQFAASLEEEPGQSQSRFVADGAEKAVRRANTDSALPTLNPEATAGGEGEGSGGKGSEEKAAMALCPPPDPDSWRQEVAARVNRYRGHRPRAPRYPSLQLRFDSSEASLNEPPKSPAPVTGQLAITMDLEPAPVVASEATQLATPEASAPPEGATKILAFPRSSFMPPFVVDELAEPVFDRPRILEVPEVLPPPPALGGISIEPTEELKDERRPGFELPLKPAPLSRRILAGMTDALVVATAFAAFAYIFFRITSIVPPLREGVSVAAGLVASFWAAYQYLLLVHTGSTPGLKLAKLELSRFDGRPVPRKLRRWRVLASVLSGLSLALGYAWCFMDEDELCWHDRITHTYMAPKASKQTSVATSH
jgi:uncharacterized RDD family membrane protein YckC